MRRDGFVPPRPNALSIVPIPSNLLLGAHPEGNMADRAARETVIRDIYDARMRGDIDGILRHTADNVEFSIAE